MSSLHRLNVTKQKLQQHLTVLKLAFSLLSLTIIYSWNSKKKITLVFQCENKLCLHQIIILKINSTWRVSRHTLPYSSHWVQLKILNIMWKKNVRSLWKLEMRKHMETAWRAWNKVPWFSPWWGAIRGLVRSRQAVFLWMMVLSNWRN